MTTCQRLILSSLVLAATAGCPATDSAGPPLSRARAGEAETVTEPADPAEPAEPPDPERTAMEAALAKAYPADAPQIIDTVKFDLRAAPTSIPMLDGRALDVWAYNGTVPGPVLRVRLGEEVVVDLDNGLPQPTTIHWHGVRVPNAMDGVPGVTQDPIPPGGTFTYRFVPKDAGTFWFHPHVRGSEQIERGLYGVLVVDDAEPEPYSRDEVWVLDDWRLGQDGQIDPNFVTRHDLAHDGRWGRMVTVNGDAGQQMEVAPGERVRLRLVNSSNGRVYRPDFGTLAPKVIAVDGMYTRQPLAMDEFVIAPGNRLDLDLTIPVDAAAGAIYPVVDRFTRNAYTLATLVVKGDPVATPTFEPPSNPNVPTWDEAAARDVDVTFVLSAQQGGEHGIQWTINGEPWGEHTPTQIKEGRWVRVRFRNDSFRLHPMHIHGQFFKVIAVDGQPVDTPYFRDTVLLRRKQTIDVGMVPIDWGKWMMHCHILEHAESGMMTEVHVED